MRLDPHLTLALAVMAFALIAIVVVAGAIVTVANPRDEPFHDYVNDLSVLGTALIAALGALLYKVASAVHSTPNPPKEDQP